VHGAISFPCLSRAATPTGGLGNGGEAGHTQSASITDLFLIFEDLGRFRKKKM